MQPLWHPPVEALTLERVFHALGDPVRLAVFGRIASAGCCSCGAICDRLPRSTLSHHLRILREAGLIHSERQGKEIVSRVRADDLESRFPGLLKIARREAKGEGMAAIARPTSKRQEVSG